LQRRRAGVPCPLPYLSAMMSRSAPWSCRRKWRPTGRGLAPCQPRAGLPSASCPNKEGTRALRPTGEGRNVLLACEGAKPVRGALPVVVGERVVQGGVINDVLGGGWEGMGMGDGSGSIPALDPPIMDSDTWSQVYRRR